MTFLDYRMIIFYVSVIFRGYLFVVFVKLASIKLQHLDKYLLFCLFFLFFLKAKRDLHL